MYFCTRCGNGRKFTGYVAAPVIVNAMTDIQVNAPAPDTARELGNLVCAECGTGDVTYLPGVTPRNLLNVIIRNHFKGTACPVEAGTKARQWFMDKAPHLAMWIQDGIPGEILVPREQVGRVAAGRNYKSPCGIYAFFAMTY